MSRTTGGDDAASAHDDARVDQDVRPSLRFRVFFTAAMIIIALGYTWVWRAKTERAIAEPAPVLALQAAAIDGGDDQALGRALLAELRAIPGLTVIDARRGRPAEPEIAQLLSAQLRPGGAGHVLELRRSDARSDAELYLYSVEGATMEEAVYRMAVQVAMSFGLPRPPEPATEPPVHGR